MEHHRLDPFPIPRKTSPMYINEPWLIDLSLSESVPEREPDKESDNIRIYAPLDLNEKSIIRRLYRVISRYGNANEKNEINYRQDVDMLISQIEIYDQIWYVRHMPKKGKHSREAIALVEKFVSLLEQIPDGGAEIFPFELIKELKSEYLLDCLKDS